MLPEILEKLRPHQRSVVQHLLEILRYCQSAADFSECGCGKTWSSAAVAACLRLPTLVVAPKTILTQWEQTAVAFGDSLSVIGWEKLRSGSTPYGAWTGRTPAPDLLKCLFCQCFFDAVAPAPCSANATGIHCVEPKKGRKIRGRFVFAPEIKFCIFDECHRASGLKSDNAELVIAARRQGIKMLLLSATPGCSPLNMRALGYALDLHQLTNFFSWAGHHGCRPHPVFRGLAWMVGAEQQKVFMGRIRDAIIPARGVRVMVAQIPGFPESDVQAISYDLEKSGQIDKCYVEMSDALKRWEASKADDKLPDSPLTAQLRARQQIEILKIPVLIELAEDFQAKGFSVAIFVSFRETIAELSRRLGTTCLIDGSEAGVANRQASIDAFQSGQSRVILCNSESGGLGVSLHDTAGEFPRAGLVSPMQSASTLKQVLGRLRREGGKSRCVYRIVFIARSVEQDVQRNLQKKLRNLDSLLDSDLTPPPG